MGGCQEGNGQRISKEGGEKIRKGGWGGKMVEDSDPDAKVYRKRNVLNPEKFKYMNWRQVVSGVGAGSTGKVKALSLLLDRLSKMHMEMSTVLSFYFS